MLLIFHERSTSWVQTWVQIIKKPLHDIMKRLSVELQGFEPWSRQGSRRAFYVRSLAYFIRGRPGTSRAYSLPLSAVEFRRAVTVPTWLSVTYDAPNSQVQWKNPGGTMAVRSSKLGSHGVAILASCCSVDFLMGELPPTPSTLTRDLRKLSIPVSPNLERTRSAPKSGVQRYAL
jgi:hypothetical protein